MRLPSGDGYGAVRSTRPPVMGRGSPVTVPDTWSTFIAQRLVLKLGAFANTIFVPSTEAEGQKLIPGAMVTGTGAPVTRACAKSKGTRYTLALSASPSWIMTPAEDMEFSGAKRSRNHFVAPQDFSSPPSTG